ncbi:MAG: phosphatidylglycerol lysyltransferase domain-containing protein [Pararhizobium sp.]
MASFRRFFDTLADRRLPAIPRATLSLEERLDAVRRHGDFSIAYSSAVQNGLSYFGDARGYIAFAAKMGTIFALGDPVAAPQDRAELIRRFVAAAGRPCFVQIERQTAEVLAGLGYRLNVMGYDTCLDLAHHRFQGKHLETVRYSERWLLKNGYTIADSARDGRAALDIETLSRRWREQRIVRKREMAFLNRKFTSEPQPGMRRFVLHAPDGAATALLDFDPMYRAGRLIGYTSFFKRKLPGTTSHAEIGMTKHAADRFREEGLERLTLGLAPVAGIAPSGHRESVWLRQFLSWAQDSELINRRIFNIKGQAAFRHRFHGTTSPFYIGFGKPMVAAQLIGFLRVCKAI